MHWMPGQTLETVEKIVIEQAFQFYRGNKTQTAQSLGIAIRTLDNKLEKYDSDRQARNAADLRAQQERERQLRRARGIVEPEEGHGSNAGIHLESTFDTGPQSEVSVPERDEVQEVLPKQASKSRAARKG